MNTRESGFTLLELVLSLMLLTVVVGAIHAVLSESSSTYATYAHAADLRERGQSALERMASEIRLADRANALITEANGAHRIDFQTPLAYTGGAVTWSDLIRYECRPSTVDANGNGIVDEARLVRVVNGQEEVLTNYVKTGGLTLIPDGDSVAVNLEMEFRDSEGNLLSWSHSTNVALRNDSTQ